MKPCGIAIYLLLFLAGSVPFGTCAQSKEKALFYAKNGKIVLGGTLNGIHEIGPGSYVVTDDIYISPSAVLKIHPGTRLWFENRARIEIAGSFVAIGDSSNPITLAALPLRRYYRNPYSSDSLWEGIVVTGKGSAIFASTTIRDSRYGIRAPGCERISLSNLTLSNIKETLVELPDHSKKGQLDKPFALTFTSAQTGEPVFSSANQVYWKEFSPIRKIAFCIFGAGAIGLSTAAICEAIIGKKNTEKGISHLEDGQNSLAPNSSSGLPVTYFDSWQNDYQKSRENYLRMNIFSIAGAACAVGFVFTIPSPKAAGVIK